MTILALVLILGAPAKSECVEDVKFALAELEKECGHFFELKGIRWGKVRRELLKDAKKARTPQDEYVLLTRLLARLRDGHAYVKTTEKTKDLQWPREKPWRGPGMHWTVAGKKVYVKQVWEPAKGAGIEPGMEVVEVEGKPVLKWLDARVDELGDRWSFSTRHRALYEACHAGLGGPEGTRLKLELKAPDGKSKKATVGCTSKSLVAWGPVFPPEGLQQVGPQSWGRTPKGYAYIHLRKTPGELPAQLDTMLEALGEVNGLILDCRANGGGGCDHDTVFGRFVPEGKTFAGYKSQGAKPFAGPMVVIVDSGVFSAGETVSGMFKEDGRAYMIGPGPTAGSSSSKKTIDLPSGLFQLYVSVWSNKKRFNSGKGVEGIGVAPHEIVPYDPDDLASGVDTLIRRAEEILQDFPRNKVAFKARG